MTSLATAVLVIYAVLMLLGGLMGYRTAGSKASLIAGIASSVALFGALAWSRSRPASGFIAGAVVALALTVVFGIRLAKTGNFMPAGMLMVVSVLALMVLALAGFRNR